MRKGEQGLCGGGAVSGAQSLPKRASAVPMPSPQLHKATPAAPVEGWGRAPLLQVAACPTGGGGTGRHHRLHGSHPNLGPGARVVRAPEQTLSPQLLRPVLSFTPRHTPGSPAQGQSWHLGSGEPRHTSAQDREEAPELQGVTVPPDTRLGFMALGPSPRPKASLVPLATAQWGCLWEPSRRTSRARPGAHTPALSPAPSTGPGWTSASARQAQRGQGQGAAAGSMDREQGTGDAQQAERGASTLPHGHLRVQRPPWSQACRLPPGGPAWSPGLRALREALAGSPPRFRPPLSLGVPS